MGAHGGLDQPSPELAVRAGFRQGETASSGHQGCVEDLQLRAGTSSPYRRAGVFLQSRQHARARQQIEIMGQRRGVARVLELAQHLGVGQDLAGIHTAQLEQPAQQRRFVHPGEQQHVAGNGRFDERVADVARPPSRMSRQRRGAAPG